LDLGGKRSGAGFGCPAIIEFLVYNPLPAATSLAERLVRGRTSMSLSQKESGERLGVDPSTLAKWERADASQPVTMPHERCDSW
jgi:hypothetical protein